MKPVFRSAPLAALLVAALISTGCSSSSIVTALDAAVTAAEAAVSILGSTGGITPAQSQLIQTYLEAVGSAASTAASELQSTDTPAEKSAVIIAAFDQAVISTNVLSRLPPAAAAAIQAVIAAVQAFLRQIKPAATLMASAEPPRFSGPDKRKLAAIGARGRKMVLKFAVRGAR